MKKFMLTSTNRRAYQSRGSDESTPRRYASSRASPRGQSRYGPLFVMNTSGGTRATRTVRESVERLTSRNAILGRRQGSVFGSRSDFESNSDKAEFRLRPPRR